MAASHRSATALRLTARRLATLLAAGALLAGIQAGAATAAIWAGGFETANLLQWDAVEAVPGDITLVHSPVRTGIWAGKFVVHPGDSPVGSGERTEVDHFSHERAGIASWWAWSTYFPTGFYSPRYTKMNVFAQWHPWHSHLKPNVSFTVMNWSRTSAPFLKMMVRGGRPTSPRVHSWRLGSLHRNAWYNFVLRVVWYPDNRGRVKLWVNRRLVVPLTGIPTFWTPVGQVYVKQGLYRGSFSQSSVVYQDAMRRGRTLTSIAPGL